MTKDEAKKLIKIELDGIANTQSEYDDGWWETSTGAEFGKERLQKVLKIVEALEQPARLVSYAPDKSTCTLNIDGEEVYFNREQPAYETESWKNNMKEAEEILAKAKFANEQPAQEPVAWIFEDELPDNYPYDEMFRYSAVIDGVRMFPVFYPAPSWVGLSDDEIDKEALKGDHAAYFALGALWANQALKEKNSGGDDAKN